MSSTTFLSARRTALVLTCAGLSLGAQAQTAPAWLSARSLGPGSTANAGAAAVDGAGNTYRTAGFTGSITLDGTTLTSMGEEDVYLAKYTPTGTLAWLRQLGSTGHDAGLDLALDATGNVYLAGSFTGSIQVGNNVVLNGGSSVSAKAFIVRYSPQGTPEWVSQSNAYLESYATANSIELDAAGNLMVTGLYQNTLSFGTSTTTTPSPTTPAGYVARFTPALTVVSLATPFAYALRAYPAYFVSPKLAPTRTGAYYLVCSLDQPITVGSTTYTTRGDLDVLVLCYSAQGAFEWAQQLGGTDDDRPSAAAADAAGNLYVAGRFSGSATFGSSAASPVLTSAGLADAYLLKLTPTGTVDWVRGSGGSGPDTVEDLTLDAAGNPYTVGSFINMVTVGPNTLTSAGAFDVVVAAYSPAGVLRWVQQAGGPGNEFGTRLDIDAGGILSVLGTHAASAAFGSFSLTSTTGATASFLARLRSTPLATQAARASVLGVYPNPATTLVRVPALAPGLPLQILDAQGRLVRATTVSAAQQVSVGGLAPGLYTLRATDTQRQQFMGRVMVQ